MQDNSRRGLVRYSDYQINTKFVLTVSRGICFLSSIHQQRTKAPQKKKKKQKASNAYKRFNYSRFIVIRKHVGGSSADFVCICANSRYLLGYWKDYRQKGKTFLQDSQSRQEAYWKSNQNLSEKAVQILKNWASLQVFTSYSQSSHLILTWTTWSED